MPCSSTRSGAAIGPSGRSTSGAFHVIRQSSHGRWLGYAELGLQVRELLPVLHELAGQAVLGGECDEGLGAVVEVLVQDLVLGAFGAVEGEVEEGVRPHDAANVGQALV